MSDYNRKMRALGKFPVVLRFERCGPADLRKLISHLDPATRKKLRHVDASRVHLNTVPHGSVAALEDLFRQTEEMAEHNMNSQALGHIHDKHPGRAKAVKAAGHKRPWDAKAQPWRQAILTVHHEYFLADDDCPVEHIREQLGANGTELRIDIRKEDRFEKAVIEWQNEEHGEAHVGSFSHRDEEGFHIHSFLAHQEERVSKGFPAGRYNWKASEHRFFRNELDQKGRRKRTGYEVAQDAIGAFFAREEHKDMNIVRGEPRAAKCRQARKMVDDLIKEASLDGMTGEAEQLPNGSKNAQAMWVLKNRVDAVEMGRSKSGMKPNDERREIAFDVLELIGALEPARRNEHSTRRAKKQLLAELERDYGTVDQILKKPDEAIAKAATDAAIERAKLDEKARRKRAEDDIKAADERRRKARELEARETALKEREGELADREKEVSKRETAMAKFASKLADVRDALYDAATKSGLTKHPLLVKAFELAGSVLPERKKNKGREL
ncbi:hypothetical protein [Sulfitobacter sp. 1A13679]|uniref:hypothetical protein n=1 Tax=Sulfitobacter sp. 1A13679 TaxID=3368597 RepID=UPI003744D13E